MTSLQQAALVVIDMQQGFLDEFWGPSTNYPRCEENVARLIHTWTTQRMPIVVVRHDSVHATSPLRAGSPGNALMPLLAEVQPELLVTKTVNSSFHGTPNLEDWLRAAGIETIVVCGIQTNMCVETTARVGGNLGFGVVVPIDATRTFDLAGPNGSIIDASTLMRVTETNLHGGGFATVTSTDAVLNDVQRQPTASATAAN